MMNVANFDVDSDDGLSPMDNISNLSDAMLVLAVGIMLALVINWKIDIVKDTSEKKPGDIVEENKLTEYEFDDANKTNEVSADDVESNYVRSGTVYKDTTTGKTYVVLD